MYKAIKESIKEKRILAGITQRDLARMVGVTGGYISQIENGTKTPSVKTLQKIANALGCPLSLLLTDCEEEGDGKNGGKIFKA